MILLGILFGLVAGTILACLATAIRGLDPETLALPDELEEAEEASGLAQVTGRFMAAEAELRGAALVSLGAAAYLGGRMLSESVAGGASVSLALGVGAALAALTGAGLGVVVPDLVVRGREAALLGRTTRLVLLVATALGPLSAIQRWLAAALSAMFGAHEAPEVAETAPEPPGAPSGALEKVLSFAGSSVAEAMTPRSDMVLIESGTGVGWSALLVNTTRHGRYPVYRGSLDEIVGVVDIGDLLGVEDRLAPVDAHVRELPVVPESKRSWDLVLEMQAGAESMALVIDEFGAVSGLVTQTDLLAELLGEIAEEGEPSPAGVRKLDASTWDLSPFLKVERLNEITGLGVPDGDYQTLAGFILHELGRIPAPRERLRWGRGEFEIVAASERRIEAVRYRMGRRGRRARGRADTRPARRRRTQPRDVQ